MTADEIIATLDLRPHPEGGFYREIFRDGANASGRSHGTSIYYLLRAGEHSHWHRVDAAEIWHWYCGEPLELRVAEVGRAGRTIVLGIDLKSGQVPQAAVPAFAWQAARPLGTYALVGCTVSPGFEFSGFELAPLGFDPFSGP